MLHYHFYQSFIYKIYWLPKWSPFLSPFHRLIYSNRGLIYDAIKKYPVRIFISYTFRKYQRKKYRIDSDIIIWRHTPALDLNDAHRYNNHRLSKRGVISFFITPLKPQSQQVVRIRWPCECYRFNQACLPWLIVGREKSI